MDLSIQAGMVTGEALQGWLHNNDLQGWLKSQSSSIYSLIEYIHRLIFVDLQEFLKDLNKDEIAKYSLRGRIFWETGQIAWRRFKENTYSLCLIMENGSCPCLPDKFSNSDTFSEKIIKHEDRTLILWGRYNRNKGSFFEQRVAGSRAITYPEVIEKQQKTYPFLEARVYINESGEPSICRFLRIGTKDSKDWPQEKEEEES